MSQPESAALAAHGPHHHRDVSGGWLRAAVFGAMDGLVTTIALVAGVGGGGGDRQVVLLTGVAGLALGGVGLLVAGALTARFTARPWWVSALRQLAFGAIAAGATYLVGSLIGVTAG